MIRIRIADDREATGPLFTGHYFERVRTSEVHINGHPVGKHSLGNTQLAVPPGVVGKELVIEQRHADAASPAQLGQSADTRLLAYHLSEMQVRLRAVSQVGSATRPMQNISPLSTTGAPKFFKRYGAERREANI